MQTIIITNNSKANFVMFYKPKGSSFWSPLMLLHALCYIKDSKLLHERQSTFCACKKISLVHWWHHTSLISFPSNVSLPWLCSLIQSLWSAKALHSIIKKHSKSQALVYIERWISLKLSRNYQQDLKYTVNQRIHLLFYFPKCFTWEQDLDQISKMQQRIH